MPTGISYEYTTGATHMRRRAYAGSHVCTWVTRLTTALVTPEGQAGP